MKELSKKDQLAKTIGCKCDKNTLGAEVTKKRRTPDNAPKPNANVKRTANQSTILHNRSIDGSVTMLLNVPRK